MRVEARGGATCPYCRVDVAHEGWDCPKCGTRHHAECAREHGTCTLLGCGAAVPTRMRRRSGALLEERPRGTFLPWLCLAVLVALPIFGGHRREKQRAAAVAADEARASATRWQLLVRLQGWLERDGLSRYVWVQQNLEGAREEYAYLLSRSRDPAAVRASLKADLIALPGARWGEKQVERLLQILERR